MKRDSAFGECAKLLSAEIVIVMVQDRLIRQGVLRDSDFLGKESAHVFL